MVDCKQSKLILKTVRTYRKSVVTILVTAPDAGELGMMLKLPGVPLAFPGVLFARNVCRVVKSKMAYRDEIDDGFDAAVFLEERYLFTLLIP